MKAGLEAYDKRVYQAGVENVRELLRELKAKGFVIIVACHDREELKLEHAF